MNYTFQNIVKIISGKLLQVAAKNKNIEQLIIDSRKLITPKTSLFFALIGNNHDGHDYIDELYRKGVRNFVISNKNIRKENWPEANMILVKNTLIAFQNLAIYHRNQFNLPVIGITGSNGKTTTKEWLFQILQSSYSIVRNPKSYNSQVGVPLSIWQINHTHSLGIFEAGISLPNEMEKLEKIIQPTIGIFTNIGNAHEEGFTSIEQKIKEKLKLFKKVKTLIYCEDHKMIDQHVRSTLSKKINLLTWSKNKKQKPTLRIEQIIKSKEATTITGLFKNKKIQFKIPFTDGGSIENAIHCWMLCNTLNVSEKIISDKMLKLSPIAMRLELKEGINNCSIINDSYNLDLESLKIALDFLDQQSQYAKKTLILSDIHQMRLSNRILYKKVAEIIRHSSLSKLIAIGPDISKYKNLFKAKRGLKCIFYSNTEEFAEQYHQNNFRDETILLKGARSFKFERIGKTLEQKTHETVLEINLNALIHNLTLFRKLIRPKTKIMAMVKAFSYGSGSYEIAKLLEYHRVSYLAVAYVDEGVELRKSGIQMPIMVMNVDFNNIDKLLKYNLEPEVYSSEHFNMLLNKLDSSFYYDHSPLSIHIKLDTGMHRLGFMEEEIAPLIQRLKNNSSKIKVASIFSHLSASDDKNKDLFTQKQIEKFGLISKVIQQEIGYKPLRHIINSAGILRFPKAQFDMVRLGIGLYGINPSSDKKLPLQQIGVLKSNIAQIKNIKKGQAIGYTAKTIAPADMKIAIINIGYADGYDRRFGNGKGVMSIHGETAPTVGNICMDMCMLDITKIKNAKPGDEAIVFGKNISIEEMARNINTIPYEILTNISRRIKRTYYQE